MDKQELLDKLERAKRVKVKHEMDLANIIQRIEKYERKLQEIEHRDTLFNENLSLWD